MGARSGQGGGKVKARWGKVGAKSAQGGGKVRARSRQGQCKNGKVICKVTSRSSRSELPQAQMTKLADIGSTGELDAHSLCEIVCSEAQCIGHYRTLKMCLGLDHQP